MWLCLLLWLVGCVSTTLSERVEGNLQCSRGFCGDDFQSPWCSSLFSRSGSDKGTRKVISRGFCQRSYSGFSVVWLTSFLFLGCVRYGEALHPGPQCSTEWSLGTFNPTGVTAKADLISRLSGDVWGVTETHLSYEGFRKFRHGLSCNRAPFPYCVPGAHCPLRKRSQEVGSFSGVMCLSRWPVRALPHSIEDSLFASARVQIYGVCINQLWITMGLVYGYPDSSLHQYPRYQTDILLEQVVDRVALQTKGPRVIMGDFNWLAGDLSQLRRLESLGFRDLQTLAHQWWGVNVCPTGRGDKVIDFVYVSPEMFPLLSNVVVDPAWPDHSAVIGKFKGDFTSIRELQWKVPGSVEWPNENWIQQLPPITGDVSLDFAQCWASIENQASNFRAQKGQPELVASQCGRGQTLETRASHAKVVPVKKGRSGEQQPRFFGGSWRYAQRYRQLRRLQCLVRLLRKSSSCHSTDVWQLWKAIRWSTGYQHGFGKWWETHGISMIDDLNRQDNCSAHVALGNAEEATRDGMVWNKCLCQQVPWSPPPLHVAHLLFAVVQFDVLSLEKSLIRVRYQHSKVARAADLSYVFKDCAKDAPEPVALLHQSCEVDIDFVEPELGRIHLCDLVRFRSGVPLVVQGKPFTLNSQKELILEVREEIPSDLSGTIRQSVVHSSVDDILKAFHDEWAPRWQRVQNLEYSQWDQVFGFVKTQLPQREWVFPSWTSDDFHRVVRQKKAKAAVGADGITRSDLLSLPPKGVDRMLHFLQCAEKDANWPHQLSVGIVNSLEKTPGSLEVTGFRPIVVYPFLYRVWSSFRSRQFLKQFLAFAPSGLRGGLPCCQAKSIWFEIAVCLEHSHRVGSCVIGIVADLVKAFNAIPRDPVYALLHHLGLPDWVIRTWGAFVAKQTRRFKVRGSLGGAIQSTSGFPEGCGWSVCAMAVIDFALDLWLKGLQVSPSVYTFVDDWQLIHETPEHHSLILERLDFFVDALQMDLDRKKSFVWGSSKDARKFLRGGNLEVLDHSRNLGAQSNFTRKCGNAVLVSRLKQMPKTWKLFRSSLAPFGKKRIALRMLAWPRAFHGVSVVRVGKAHFETARTQALRGLRGDRVGAHPVLHLSTLGHTFDPEGWCIQLTFKDAREFGTSNHYRHLLIQSFCDPSSIPKNGPVAILRDRADMLGWHVTADGLLCDEIGPFDFFDLSIGVLQRRIAWSWPAIMAREVAHRASFAGIQWADLGEVPRLFKVFSPSDQIYLRCAMDGTMYTQQGRHHWQNSDSHLCPWCKSPDSFEHRLWECSEFAEVRGQVPGDVLQALPQYPSCLRLHGWPIRSEEQLAFHQMLEAIPEVDAACYNLDQCQGTGHDLFIDGACALPADWTCRISSFAVTVAQPWLSTWEHSLVVAGHVPGLLQSPFRAELWALVHAVQIASSLAGSVRIWTDCGGLLAGIFNLCSADRLVKANQHHADLWHRVVGLVKQIGDRLTFHKVVSHISPSGGCTAVEQWVFWHNGLVDQAASAMNSRRSEVFHTCWQKCCTEVASQRRVCLEVARHIVRIGKRAHESREKPTRERDLIQVAKYGSKVNNICVPNSVVLPKGFGNKYGHSFSQALLQWWLQTGHVFLKREGKLRWISYTQLFCDFLLGTRHQGVWLIDGQWGIDPGAVSPEIAPNFAQRSRWFQMALKVFWKQCGVNIVTKLQRPASSVLACWQSSALLLWDDWRLEQVDTAIHRQLGYVTKSVTLEGLHPFHQNDDMVLSW